MDKCKTCDEWVFYPKSHVCDPVWEVLDECGDRSDNVFAYDIVEAAEKAAKHYMEMSGEHQDTIEVSVRAAGTEKWTKFIVSVEYEPTFTATEASDDK